jgi:hypothetical protein
MPSTEGPSTARHGFLAATYPAMLEERHGGTLGLTRINGKWTMVADLFVRNVRRLGGDLTDILILAGRIVVGPAPTGVPVLDVGERIAPPGLEAHTHLDKSLLGLPWYRNEVGSRLIDKIENERKVRKMLPIDPRRQSELQRAFRCRMAAPSSAVTSTWTPSAAWPASKV